MPTYEYVCKKCGKSLELFQSFADKPLKVHVECGGDLQKVFHARGIVFKGSGFYATDAKGSDSSRSDEAKTSSNGGSKKTETKTAPTPSPTD